MDLVGNDAFDIRMAADVIAGDLATATCHLFKGDISPTRETTRAELIAGEADYTGYALEAITWLTPSIADDGEVEVVGTVGEFRPTAATVGNTIFGLYILSAAVGTPLIFCARFDSPPLPMSATTDSIIVTIRWRPRTGGLVVTVS